MTKQIKSKRGLLNAYNRCSPEVRDYFEHIPTLIDDFPLDVCLAYVFSRFELGQNMALYCGVVKLYRANAELARNAIGTHYMTREGFAKIYRTVFGVNLPAQARVYLKTAENTRDTVMHGKVASEDRMRNAIARVRAPGEGNPGGPRGKDYTGLDGHRLGKDGVLPLPNHQQVPSPP